MDLINEAIEAAYNSKLVAAEALLNKALSDPSLQVALNKSSSAPCKSESVAAAPLTARDAQFVLLRAHYLLSEITTLRAILTEDADDYTLANEKVNAAEVMQNGNVSEF